MNNNIVSQLNKAYYVRSKISHYPISHNMLPVPNGMSVVIFQNQQDIDEYLQSRGVTDLKDFDILRVTSFYDFMREVADIGYMGIWFYNNSPIFFGNNVSDIDIEIPSFAYTFKNQFIGASGEIDAPKQFLPWENYLKTDKILRRFVRFVNGVPFSFKDELFTIVYTDERYFKSVTTGGKKYHIRYCCFPDASPLQGPYVSDIGAYCLFTDEENAQRYLSSHNISDESIYAIEKVDGIHSFLDSVSDNFPFIDIGINPKCERYLQGYFLRQSDCWLIKMVHGVYRVTEDGGLIEIEDNEDISESLRKSDTIERPNTMDPSLRDLRTTVKNPLKNLLKTTKSSLSRREAEHLMNKTIETSKYLDGHSADCIIKKEDISTDSFLVFGFDKVMGHPLGNNEEMIGPYVFEDIIDAILYFYHRHFSFEYELRFDGFVHCQSNQTLEGSQNKELEEYLLSEQRVALKDLMMMIFTEGCKLEHSELLKSFINRSSISLEIEECGYLGDLSIFRESYLESQLDEYENDDIEHEDDGIAETIIRISAKYNNRLSNNIQLDDKYQNKLRIYLGHTHRNVSSESLLILESAIREFESVEERINHDYAGIAMKLCKVFERELNRLVFQSWKDKTSNDYTKDGLKAQMQHTEKNGDETTRKLIDWLLKRTKLELGSMTYILQRIIDNCDNDLLNHFMEHISMLNNHDFILSQEILQICKSISTRYRNGGVHEKIVSYEICVEAFENILMKEENYLKKLMDI
jgi:hypothetical protein